MRGSAKRSPEARWPACSTGPLMWRKVSSARMQSKLRRSTSSSRRLAARPMAQFGEVMQAFADAEVVAVVDGGLGAQGALLLVILLDASVFVVDVERGGDALSEDAGSHPS